MHLTIFFIASLVVHLSGAFLIENHSSRSTPVERHHFAYNIVERASVKTVQKATRQPIAKKMAPRKGFESSPSNDPETANTNASDIAYTSPDHVDEMASVLYVPALPAPTASTQDTGIAILVIYVGINGAPDFVEVEQSSLPKDYTDLLAQHFKMARFKPAVLFGVPVSSWRRIEIGLDETTFDDLSQHAGELGDT